MKNKYLLVVTMILSAALLLCGCAVLKEQTRLQREKREQEEAALQAKIDNFNANEDSDDLMVCKKKTPTGSHIAVNECRIIKGGKSGN